MPWATPFFAGHNRRLRTNDRMAESCARFRPSPVLPVRLSQGRRPAATDDRPTQRRRRYHSSPALVGATRFVAGAFRLVRMRGRLEGHGNPRLDAAALMAGHGKLRWVNIDCRHCGHGTVAEPLQFLPELPKGRDSPSVPLADVSRCSNSCMGSSRPPVTPAEILDKLRRAPSPC
jgi:hypothetical protein